MEEPWFEGWRKDRREATFFSMAMTTFCTTCKRTVYIEEQDTFVCPVCSSPLLETIATNGDEVPEGGATRPA